MPKDRKQLISQTLKQFRVAIMMLIRSEKGLWACVFAFLLVLMMMGINGLNVLNSYVGRDFMSAIESKNVIGFREHAILYALVFAASTIVSAFFRFTEECLGILWREQLTGKLAESYLSERTYFRLDSATGVANPDQRISEDVRAFTTTTLSFMLLILNGTVTAISFSGVLWSISPTLFGVAVLYAVIGSVVTILLGKPLIRLNYHQFDLEANFRADLIHVRENSESIALAHREGRFKRRLRKHLDALAGNFRKLIRINRNLAFFTNGYNYFIQLIPALIVAPMYMAGKAEFGVITQSTMAFATLLGAFSLIVTQFQSISAFTAVTARLHLLTEAIEKAHEAQPCAVSVVEQPDRVAYENVTLRSADDSRLLLDRLTYDIPAGVHCAVICPDDAPMVALFRATAGVWDRGTGKVTRPGLEEILFLPERPYLPPGALRDALLRTGRENQTSDDEIHVVLNRLGLEETVRRAGGLSADRDWDDEFSIGEQHLLSIARLFLSNPAIVFLDRPGSSLPTSQVAVILKMLKEQGIGVVVFAKNGESKLQFDQVLTIHPDGTWTAGREGYCGSTNGAPDLRDLSC